MAMVQSEGQGIMQTKAALIARINRALALAAVWSI
jgi:hypothetical protein